MSQSPSFPLRVVSYATSIIVTRKVIIKMMLRVTSVMLWSNHLIGISFNPHNNLIRKMLRFYFIFSKRENKVSESWLVAGLGFVPYSAHKAN